MYALCVSVDYPGDFSLNGWHWRVIKGVQARSVCEAHDHFDDIHLKARHEKHMATTYDPAMDVLAQRVSTRS
jgi:hypothetical protein